MFDYLLSVVHGDLVNNRFSKMEDHLLTILFSYFGVHNCGD